MLNAGFATSIGMEKLIFRFANHSSSSSSEVSSNGILRVRLQSYTVTTNYLQYILSYMALGSRIFSLGYDELAAQTSLSTLHATTLPIVSFNQNATCLERSL